MGVRSAGISVALTVAAAVPAGASATSAVSATIYHCVQANGHVLYADVPCKGGVVVDIRPGVPDPTAIDRLDRQNAAFDRNMAARAANEQNAAARRQEIYLRRQELEATQAAAAAAAAPGYVPAYGYPAVFTRRHAARPRPPAHVETVPQGRVSAEIRRPHPS
jgi:hypothetical protein